MKEIAALVVAQEDENEEGEAHDETVALEGTQQKAIADAKATDVDEYENPYKDNTRNLISEANKQALLKKMSCGRKTVNCIACTFVIVLNLVSFVISVGFDMSKEKYNS